MNPKSVLLAASMMALASRLSFAAVGGDTSKIAPASGDDSSKAVARAAVTLDTRYLPDAPLMIAAVQPGAADNYLKMYDGGKEKDASNADMIAGVFQLLKDQVDGSIAAAFYADESGKPDSVLFTMHLKQSELAKELLSGALMMQGGDSKSSAPPKVSYRGQTLYTIEAPTSWEKASPVPLQPTFTVTTTNYVILGTTLAAVKKSLDAGSTPSATKNSADFVGAFKKFPPSPVTDIWLYVAKPTGAMSLGKIPIPMLGAPVGPVVFTIRFAPDGVRFEGLASLSREKASKASP